jgi:hypothetical protein
MTAGKHQLSTHAQGFGTVQVTARLVVRRVKDKNHQDALFLESKHQGGRCSLVPPDPHADPGHSGILVKRSGRSADMS